MNIIKNTPIAISGLMLALFSLGSHFNNYMNNSNILLGSVGVIILFLLVLRLIFYPQDFLMEFDNIIVASTSGTFSMALMMFSTYILPYNSTISFIIWTVAVFLHILLIIYFTYRYILHDYSLENVYPSYWIVYIGISMASITGSSYMGSYNYIFFLFGFIMMFPTLILVSYRYIKKTVTNDAFKPLICIYTAILSILIVAYVNSFTDVSYTFLIIIYTFACLFYLLALYKLIQYRHIAFYPSYSAYSFPFVISLVATYKMYNIFDNVILGYILTIETVIAIICVGYVLIEYISNIYLNDCLKK